MHRLLVALALLLVVEHQAVAAPAVVASRSDAYIAHDAGSAQWTIGSHDFAITIALDRSNGLTLGAAKNETTGRAWQLASTVAATLGGERVILGNSGSTNLLSTEAIATDYTVQLTFTFEDRTSHAKLSRVYVCAPGSPTLETWTRIEAAADAPVTVSDINTLDFQMPNATVRWLSGLRGDSNDNAENSAFGLAQRNLDVGERFDIGSEQRSTEQYVPFVIVDNGQDEFYGGLMWSGSWDIAVERIGGNLKVNAYFPGVVTTVVPGTPFEFPHAFFGVKPRSSLDESGALRQFVIQGLRQGRGFQPLVTYNTWFPYGARINEGNVMRELLQAAVTGVELFVVDAGWYVQAGSGGPFDYTSGLGTWAVDDVRFPSGLGALADAAHQAGMKFGIWVEPERVALDTVNKPGLAADSWLATHDGSYGSADSAQVCFGTAAARRWVLERLSALIEQSHADYLKWDNNFWTNCNSDAHDHGPDDGNMAHVKGLYSVLAELRTRYPDLLIENVSGGGNRLDFGLLAYTDVAWMDDRSAPSDHVRHNLEGLTFAFPPAYLLSFVVDGEAEPLRGASDPINIARSRMAGVLGLSFGSPTLSQSEIDVVAQQVATYKEIRDVVANGNATLLSDQAPVDEINWDVLQEVTDDGHRVVLFAYKGNDDDGRLIVRLRGLDFEATYDIQSTDSGPLGSATGDELMSDGVEVVHASGGTRAHIIIATAR